MAQTPLEAAVLQAEARLKAWPSNSPQMMAAQNVVLLAEVAQAQALDRIALALEALTGVANRFEDVHLHDLKETLSMIAQGVRR